MPRAESGGVEHRQQRLVVFDGAGERHCLLGEADRNLGVGRRLPGRGQPRQQSRPERRIGCIDPIERLLQEPDEHRVHHPDPQLGAVGQRRAREPDGVAQSACPFPGRTGQLPAPPPGSGTGQGLGEAELEVDLGRSVRSSLQGLERALEELCGSLEGQRPERGLAGLPGQVGRLRRIRVGQCGEQVMGHGLLDGTHPPCPAPRHRLAGPAMQRRASRRIQPLLELGAEERVSEGEAASPGGLGDDPGEERDTQPLAQRCPIDPHHLGQQLRVDVPPEDRRPLQHVANRELETAQPLGDDRADPERDFPGRGTAPDLPQHLLHEEGVASAGGVKRLHQRVAHWLQVGQEPGDLQTPEARQGQRRAMPGDAAQQLAEPGIDTHLGLAVRAHQQHPGPAQGSRDELGGQQREAIGGVQVLEDDQEGPSGRSLGEESAQCIEAAEALCLQVLPGGERARGRARLPQRPEVAPQLLSRNGQ